MNAKHKGAAKLWLLNIVGNAALVACFYYWLLLPDAHGWQVAASGLLALVVIFFGVWLRAGSFAYFRVGEFREHDAVWHAFRHAPRHMIALVLWVIPLAVIEWWLLSLRIYVPQFGVWAWQKGLRLGSPRQVYHFSDWLLWFVVWLLPFLWLPVGSTVAAAGIKAKRMSRSLRLLKRPVYWAWVVMLLLVGAYLPYKLVWWIPDLSTLRKQAWSAGFRFAVAYLLLISAWVALLLVIGERVEKEDPERILLTTTEPTPANKP